MHFGGSYHVFKISMNATSTRVRVTPASCVSTPSVVIRVATQTTTSQTQIMKRTNSSADPDSDTIWRREDVQVGREKGWMWRDVDGVGERWWV